MGDAVTDAERKAYAEELVLACRKKDIGAIAITDHHDLSSFRTSKRPQKKSSTTLASLFQKKDESLFFLALKSP